MEEFLLEGIQSQRYSTKIDPKRIDFTGLIFEGNFEGTTVYDFSSVVQYDLTTTTYDSNLDVVSQSPQSLDNFLSVATTPLMALSSGTQTVIKVGTDTRSDYSTEYMDGIDTSTNIVNIPNSIVSVKTTPTQLEWKLWNSYTMASTPGNFLHFAELDRINTIRPGSYYVCRIA